ncbi:MAG: hypothetical protein JWR68_1518 [Polaromonas sp.]|nr:hypothetical protein [Polaromonas sp.]
MPMLMPMPPLAVAPVMLCLALSACGDTAPIAADTNMSRYSQEEVQEHLAGTWLREYSEKGIQARRILVLSPDGAFLETVRITDATGQVSEQVHAGFWLYDGTNLKRKYTSMNGKPPSRLNLPFATFQIRFDSKNEFTGIDHVHRNRIQYQRVAPEILP